MSESVSSLDELVCCRQAAMANPEEEAAVDIVVEQYMASRH
jgi:hypothetical protein